ncbi:acetamidase/formamidase family protein [Salinicoccus albus]|uniref:acetamidase/formamidase family protein n=1 Tax=Salinicoccus albus TaxID=418756 RepID=UPI0003A9E68C|nr:acetamidase/formamidase family protein [Salinicoccus albus]
MKHVLDKTNLYYVMSKKEEPVLNINPGDTVEIHTADCFSDQIISPDMDFSAVDWSNSNPATGPIYVNDIHPGDVLKVTIETIELGSRGLATVNAGAGVMRDYIEKRCVKMFDVDTEHHTTNFNGLIMPLNPMIGVIGNAPADASVPNSTPGPHGGNMDSKKCTDKSIVYLPVFQEGALFGLGDVHAKMGDGEVGISGLEIDAAVTVKLEKAENLATVHPVVIDEEGIYMFVSDESLDNGVDESVKQMIKILQPLTDLSLEEITILMSLAGEAQINQVVDPLKTARFFIPHYVLNHYSIEFS